MGSSWHFPSPSHLAMSRRYDAGTYACLLNWRYSAAFQSVCGVRIQGTTCHSNSVTQGSRSISLQKNIRAFPAARAGVGVRGCRRRALVSPLSAQSPAESSFFRKANEQKRKSHLWAPLGCVTISQKRRRGNITAANFYILMAMRKTWLFLAVSEALCSSTANSATVSPKRTREAEVVRLKK